MGTDKAVWAARPISASAFLRDVRDECLNRSEKRMPKWKFRIAPDFVIQLQPRPTYLPTAWQISKGVRVQLLRFDGVAIAVETGIATAELFTKKPDSKTTRWARTTFQIFAYDNKAWQLKLKAGRWSNRYKEGWQALNERLFDTFRGNFLTTLTPAAMLGDYCLVCGKRLTDLASMARRIGPECASTSSLVVPWVIEAKQPSRSTDNSSPLHPNR